MFASLHPLIVAQFPVLQEECAARRRSRSPEGHRHENELLRLRMHQLRVERRHETCETAQNYCETAFDEFKESLIEHCHELLRMDFPCGKCGALMWREERLSYNPAVRAQNNNFKFGLCCKSGKVKIEPIKPPPEYLMKLFTRQDPDSAHFFSKVRLINNLLAFASMRCNQRQLPSGGPPVVIMQGTVYHVIGSLLPPGEMNPSFMSLYIYDPEQGLVNRISHEDVQHVKTKRIITNLQAIYTTVTSSLTCLKVEPRHCKNNQRQVASVWC